MINGIIHNPIMLLSLIIEVFILDQNGHIAMSNLLIINTLKK